MPQKPTPLSLPATMSLPKALKEVLERQGVSQEEILAGAEADMTLDCEYALGWCLLTKKNLFLCITPPLKGEQKTFGGPLVKVDNQPPRDWAVKHFALEDTESLEVNDLVSGGVLVRKDSQNLESQLLAFTNQHKADMRRLCGLLSKVKEGKELTEEDFKQEDKAEYCPKCGSMYPDKERRICPKCMDKRSVIMRLLGNFKPYKVQIFFMFLCILGCTCLGLLYPYLNGTILYNKVLGQDEEFLRLWGLPAGKFTLLLGGVVIVMALTQLTNQAMAISQMVITAKIVPHVVNDLKAKVFEAMNKLSVGFYNSRQTGGLMTRVISDAGEVMQFLIDGVPFLLMHGLGMLITVIIMFVMNWKLALVSLFLLPILTYLSFRIMPRLWTMYGRRHRASRSLNGQINDNITGARVVKAFGQERSEEQRFTGYNGRVRGVEMDLVRCNNQIYALFVGVEQIINVLVWSVSAVLMFTTQEMDVGTMMTFTGYVVYLQGPLNFLAEFFRWGTMSTNSAQRIFEILDAVPEIQESPNPVRREHIEGSVSLKNVTFGYEAGKPVLSDISVEIPAGQVLGIVGRSGAGKSTLVNLISRLYDPQEGSISIDGINLKDLAMDNLRGSVAMVSQETYIFMGTVAANIAYARPEATREEIISAAIAAAAHDFICRMPDGYDTVIGSSGRQLSGGERQRISIARAILTNPRILILDEATASVDTETERAIQSSVDRLVKGRTTISIAHRLSTLNNADKLVVIDGGKITEYGTHQELIQKKGTYEKLMRLQQKALAMRGLED